MKVNEKNINNFRQNKIKYLVRDFAEYGVPEEATREILLKRGINKWLANRSAIIGLKDGMLGYIRFCLSIMKAIDMIEGKENLFYKEVLGQLKALIAVRRNIRKICHSSRYVFPE